MISKKLVKYIKYFIMIAVKCLFRYNNCFISDSSNILNKCVIKCGRTPVSDKKNYLYLCRKRKYVCRIIFIIYIMINIKQFIKIICLNPTFLHRNKSVG